jgi:hypothetical protein
MTCDVTFEKMHLCFHCKIKLFICLRRTYFLQHSFNQPICFGRVAICVLKELTLVAVSELSSPERKIEDMCKFDVATQPNQEVLYTNGKVWT